MATKKTDLEALITRLNHVTGSPLRPYKSERGNGKLIANVGHYSLDWAYGGVKLERVANEVGGVSIPVPMGYVKKSDCERVLRAFIAGAESILRK